VEYIIGGSNVPTSSHARISMVGGLDRWAAYDLERAINKLSDRDDTTNALQSLETEVIELRSEVKSLTSAVADLKDAVADLDEVIVGLTEAILAKAIAKEVTSA